MQRLDDSDIFFVPAGQGCRICRFAPHGIIQGSRLSLPVSVPVAISAEGWCAAITGKGRRLVKAKIGADLKATQISSVLLPPNTQASAVAVCRDRLFVGGTQENHTWLVQAMLSPGEPELGAVPVPEDLISVNKPIDELLVVGEKLLAVDDFIYPKWMLAYSLSSSGEPSDPSVAELVTHHTYEHVKHGAVGRKWLALLSSSAGRGGAFRHIAFYDTRRMVEVCLATFRAGTRRSQEGFVSGFAPLGVGALATGWRPIEDRRLEGLVPQQIVCVRDRFFILDQHGRVFILDFSNTEPLECEHWILTGKSFSLASFSDMPGGPPTMLVAVSTRDAVIAANHCGELAVIVVGDDG